MNAVDELREARLKKEELKAAEEVVENKLRELNHKIWDELVDAIRSLKEFDNVCQDSATWSKASKILISVDNPYYDANKLQK